MSAKTIKKQKKKSKKKSKSTLVKKKISKIQKKIRISIVERKALHGIEKMKENASLMCSTASNTTIINRA